MQPPSVSVVSVFSQRWAERVQAMALVEVQYKATERLHELVNDLIDGCLATQTMTESLGLVSEMH